jgi:tetratricopeptide (TPR) repeat protein
MKRLALSFLLAVCLAPRAWSDPNPVDELFKQAQEAAKNSKWDDAIGYYEKVIEEHPEDPGRWFEVQLNITQMLIKKGDWDAAAKSAHLCIDAAPNLGAFDNAVVFTAAVLSAQDKGIDRANQFLNFELTGGTDGKPNPLDAVGYPSNPARDAAFATMRQQAGDDSIGCRLRAYTYLLSGKPKDALGNFADAFRRNENPYDLTNAGVELVATGLRAAQGHRVGLDKAMQFVIYGPAGPDGKAGTSDDIPDPFASLMPPVPSPGSGGYAGFSPDDLATLEKVRDAAQLYAGDPLLPSDGIRRNALSALQRLNDALDGWGAPGQKDWYLRLALGIGCLPPDEYTTGYLIGAESAARGRGNNYGGVRALWTEIDSLCATNKIDPPKHLGDLTKQFEGVCKNLGQIQFPKPSYNLLKNPATF